MNNKGQNKKGLNNLKTYEPKPEIWDNIESALNNDDKPNIVYWRWVTGIAATLAIIFAVNGVFKDEIRPAIVEVNMGTDKPVIPTDTNQHETVNIEKIPAPKTPKLETPTTGPWDGKAGDALRDPNTTVHQPNDNPVLVSADSILTSGNDVTFSNTNTVNTGAVTYSWDFGSGQTDKTSQTQVNQAFSPTTPITFNVDNIQSTDQLTLSYTAPDVSAAYTGSGTYTLVTGDLDNKTTYKAPDNVGFVDNSAVDADGVGNYVDTDALTKDVNQTTLSSKDISTLPARRGGAIATHQTGTLAATKITRHRNKGKLKINANSEIQIPAKRVLENEKYQCIVADSVGGLSAGRQLGYYEPNNTESYLPLIENEYKRPTQDPLSTFGIDVDNASYAVMRAKINGNTIVPKDAVRVEEFINYFDYNYPEPDAGMPFSINLENATCPWNDSHNLVRIGLKGKDINYAEKQNSNLVFLIDVSGSMDSENKLPLVKKSMKLLVDQMGANDRIAIVTYAGAAGLALESTACNEKEYIKRKINKLDAGGSTAGGEGIKLAYNVAVENLISKGNNRVIMCTDGDFNVGQSADSEMKKLIVNNRNKGVFITVCGFGMGNYQDSKMETIADNGNGNYFYIDTYRESEKVFNREIRATLFTIAKDVKIQVEFNPKHVKAYRLIGYENRKMPPQDFNDDTKDGGELGAGHTVTALYEVIPANSDEAIPGEINLKYQKPNDMSLTDFGDEMLTVKLRYKQPKGTASQLLVKTMTNSVTSFSTASQDFQFATGVALYAQQLRQSKFIDQKDFTLAESILQDAKGADFNGDREELLTLMKKAKRLYQVYTKE